MGCGGERSERLIRRIGLAVETCEEAKFCLEREGLASPQINLKIFRQRPSELIFDAARAKGVALIVRFPLASGLLSGKFTAETDLSAGAHRNYNRDGAASNVGETFACLPFKAGLELAGEVRPILPDGKDRSAAAVRWTSDHERVTVVSPGDSREGQCGVEQRRFS